MRYPSRTMPTGAARRAAFGHRAGFAFNSGRNPPERHLRNFRDMQGAPVCGL